MYNSATWGPWPIWSASGQEHFCPVDLTGPPVSFPWGKVWGSALLTVNAHINAKYYGVAFEKCYLSATYYYCGFIIVGEYNGFQQLMI